VLPKVQVNVTNTLIRRHVPHRIPATIHFYCFVSIVLSTVEVIWLRILCLGAMLNSAELVTSERGLFQMPVPTVDRSLMDFRKYTKRWYSRFNSLNFIRIPPDWKSEGTITDSPVTVVARSKAWTVFSRSDASPSQWPRGLRHELSSLA
jgi:hypothetical protein